MFAATQQIASVAGLKATKVQVSNSNWPLLFLSRFVLFDRFEDTRARIREEFESSFFIPYLFSLQFLENSARCILGCRELKTWPITDPRKDELKTRSNARLFFIFALWCRSDPRIGTSPRRSKKDTERERRGEKSGFCAIRKKKDFLWFFFLCVCGDLFFFFSLF